MIETILLNALCGWICNSYIRGGLIEAIFLGSGRNRKWVLWCLEKGILNIQTDGTVNVPGLRIVNALLYGGSAWYQSGSATAAACLCIFMYLGSTLALGDYMRALKQQGSDKSRLWGFGMLTLRGLAWGLIIGAGAVVYNFIEGYDRLYEFIAVTAVSGSLQGLINWSMIEICDRFRINNRFVNFWSSAERLHGAVMWQSLGLL